MDTEVSSLDVAEEEHVWLEQVTSSLDDPNPSGLSWAAYHSQKPSSIISMLPIFNESSNSFAMIRHAMSIVILNINFLNPGQIPVIALDQPLYAIGKQIQWKWRKEFGEDHLVLMMGGLHIEMAAFKVLGV